MDALLAAPVLRQATFGGQEQVHESACGASGTSVEHGYVWIAGDG